MATPASPNKSWYSIKPLNLALASGAPAKAAEISIHDEIGLWGIGFNQFAREVKALGDLDSIQVSINSYGGEVFDGLAIYNYLRNHKANVTVRVEGIAASIASVIAMAGDEIQIPENAFLMVHNPWGVSIGDSEEMRKMADVMDKMRDSIVSAYRTKTGLEDKELVRMMDDETWMNGAEAVEKGFADTLTGAVALAACARPFDTRRFSKVPTALVNSMSAPSTPAPADPAPAAPVESPTPEPQQAAAPVEPTAPASGTDPALAPATPEPAQNKGWIANAVDAITGANRIKAELATANSIITAKDTEIADLKAQLATMKTQNAELEQLRAALNSATASQQSASQQAAAIVASHGFTPETAAVLPEASSGPDDLAAQFENADPAQRSALLRKHGLAKIQASWLAANPPKAGK